MNLNFAKIADYMPMYINGIQVTLKFTGLSLLFGFILGVLLAVGKVSNIKILNLFGTVYTSIFRGIPLLVQIFMVYFATPQLFGWQITALQAGVITFAFNSSAYISESLRGGIMGVDKGQREAAMALGVSYKSMMIDIVMPQALKHVLPALVNESINLLKESALVSTIGVVDTMRTSQLIMNKTYIAFEPLLISASIYYVFVMILTGISTLLERRLRRSDRD